MLNRLDRIFIKIESTICVISFLAMVAVVVWSVLCRYFLEIKFIYAEELTRNLTVYAIFFGTSLAVKEKAHVGVEAFVNLLPESGRKNLQIVTDILTCQTTTLTKIPMTIAYFCVPAGMFLSVLHSLNQIVQEIKARKNNPGSEEAAK